MTDAELIRALHRLKVESGSLACLGCGHEHNCSTRGCAILRAAEDRIDRDRWISVRDALPVTDACGYSADVYVTDGEDITKAQLARYWDGTTNWGYTGIGEITHWRYHIPLPEPPKEET